MKHYHVFALLTLILGAAGGWGLMDASVAWNRIVGAGCALLLHWATAPHTATHSAKSNPGKG